MADDSEYVKIVVDLPDAEDGMSGEGLWTKYLGDELYEVPNSPWHSREINYLDVVKARSPSPDKHPLFFRVERRSGHRTIHVVLMTEDQNRRKDILAKLNEAGGTYEGANSTLYAFDFAPDVDWKPALDLLAELQGQGEADFRYSAC